MTALGRMALLAAAHALAAAPAAAQGDGCTSLLGPAAAGDSARAPLVVVRATAELRELRFQTRPRTDVRTMGCAGVDSRAATERVNLPDPVEPGVTYRDVRVGTEIRAHLDVACLPALAADPAFAALCGTGAPTPAASPARQPSSQQQTQQTQQQPPNAPAPTNPPRR